MSDTDYALDMSSPVRHVATELDRVSPGTLSLGELVDSYEHPNRGDIVRIKEHEGCESDRDALLWLINRAISKLEWRGQPLTSTRQIVPIAGNYRLAEGVSFGNLRYNGKGLHRERDDHAQFRDPFNPMSGRFADNLRRGLGNVEELRESMRNFGWLADFPAIKDERGVVLVGHRRLAVAEELGIEPVVRTVRLGDGDEADARRFALAIASNLGGKSFTAEERKDIAEYLHGEREWSQQRIAVALQVSQATISGDLSELSTADNSGKPKRGRPKGTRKAPPELDAEVMSRVEAGEPVSRRELAEKYGVGDKTIQLAHNRALGRMEERKAHPAPPPPEEPSSPEPPPPERVPAETGDAVEAVGDTEPHACPKCGYLHETPTD